MEEKLTPFINLQSDFGFKHTFGSEKNKPALIRLLNALFAGELRVNDVVYHDKEILPAAKDGKRIVYDVYCTSLTPKARSQFLTEYDMDRDKEESRDHHFILEMQNIYNPPFEERIVYYGAKMVAEQGFPGWDYSLSPVFVIAIMDFNFDHMKPKLMRDVMLCDRESGEALTEKVHFYLCSLKKLPKKWEECRTEEEKALYLIKNMDRMDSTSTAYRSGEFTEFFEAARSNKLDAREVVAYKDSLQRLIDDERGLKWAAKKAAKKAAEKAAKKAHAEGMAEGRAEGLNEGLRKVALNLLSMGHQDTEIGIATGLSIDEIQALRNAVNN